MLTLAFLLIRIFLGIRFYPGVFWVLYIFSKAEPLNKEKRKRVLYLSKPIFNDDVEALKKYGKNFEYIRFPRPLLRPVLKHFVPYGDELNDANYHVKTKDDEALNALRAFWDKCIPYLQRKLKFDVILSGNFVYVTQQEMFRAARKHNIPSVVLYKEGMFPMDRNNDVIEIFYTTKQFLADKILFYNEGIRDILVKSNLPGLSADKTAVVGVPRFDYLIKEKPVFDSNSKQIVLFAFEPKNKSEYLLEDINLKESFEKALIEFQVGFINLAMQRPDIKLTIKSKPDPQSISSIHNLLEKANCTSLPRNIQVSHKMNVQRLIRESTYVAGYSSTTLIEGLIQGKKVLSPSVFEFFKNKSADLFQGLDLGVIYTNSRHELEMLILNGSTPETNNSRRQLNKFLNSMVYQLDGKASSRVEKEILKLI